MDERVAVVEEWIAKDEAIQKMDTSDQLEIVDLLRIANLIGENLLPALRGLMEEGHPKAESLFLRLMECKHYNLRVAAVKAAWHAKEPSDTIIARLRTELKASGYRFLHAAEYLRRFKIPPTDARETIAYLRSLDRKSTEWQANWNSIFNELRERGAVDILTALRDHPTGMYRQSAVEALGALGQLEEVAHLVEEGENVSIRSSICFTILKTRGKEAFSAIAKALTDDFEREDGGRVAVMHDRCWVDLMVKLGREDSRVFDLMAAILQTRRASYDLEVGVPDWIHRGHAMEILGTLGGDGVFDILAGQQPRPPPWSHDDMWRSWAMEAYGCGSAEMEGLMRGLGELGDPRGIPIIRELLTTGTRFGFADSPLYEIAFKALEKLGVPIPEEERAALNPKAGEVVAVKWFKLYGGSELPEHAEATIRVGKTYIVPVVSFDPRYSKEDRSQEWFWDEYGEDCEDYSFIFIVKAGSPQAARDKINGVFFCREIEHPSRPAQPTFTELEPETDGTFHIPPEDTIQRPGEVGFTAEKAISLFERDSGPVSKLYYYDLLAESEETGAPVFYLE